MKIQILLFFFFLCLLISDDVSAGRSGSRGSSSRGSSSRGSSSRGWSRSWFSSGSRSPSKPSVSRPSGGQKSSPNTFGNSGSHASSSTHIGSLPGTGLSTSGHRNPSNGAATRPGTIEQASSPGHTSHQQNKDASTSILHAERGSATVQTNPTQHSAGQPSAPHSNTGIYPGGQTGRLGFTTDNKQNTSPYKPSAPPADHLSKSTSQNHAPTSFGQSNTPFNPSRGTIPNNNNPPWSNPHYNPIQPYPPGPVSSNVGFKDHLRPSSMPVPSHVSSSSYPHHSYPTSTHNQHYPPYPIHPSSHTYQSHSVYNPSHFPGQTIGHPPAYPAHIPPPAQGSFGNPYSVHPAGSAYSSAGHNYYPQQQVLAQPAAQPYIPGHTIITVPSNQNSGRGFGDMVKEALVFSTINAGVNRILNPYPHHHHFVSDSGRPASGTTSETHITYNNHYFNGAPADNNPASSNTLQNGGSVSYPANYPTPVNNPAINPGVSIPAIVASSNVTNVNPVATSNFSPGTMDPVNEPRVAPVVASNGNPAGNTNDQAASDQGMAANIPQYRISDNEIQMLTEELFEKQEISISKYLTLHLQNSTKSQNITDEASGPLIRTLSEVHDYPTILAIESLYDNYEHNSTVKEKRTLTERKEENLLLDIFLNTDVMARAMQWLSDRGFIDPDDFERKDILRYIWFSQFDGSTSGFERVFASERYGSDLLGVQDWIYFNYEESKGRIDYMGYVDTLKLGDNASLVKLNFRMDDIVRPNATIFVGTLPELEMSLYTICFFVRPNNLCPVSLGGGKFNIYTHSFRYYGKDLIDLALPMF